MKRRSFVFSHAVGLVGANSLLVREVFAADPVKVGLMIPLSGPAGLFGPSSKNCGELAVAHINANGGLLGRPIELIVSDAGVAPAEASQAALKLWKGQKVEAFIGMHDSAVRGALTGVFKGQVPYIYTSTYEGGECSPGIQVLAETPAQQLEPVIPWLSAERKLKNWYLIGNDYNWPRDTNALAKQYIAKSGGKVVGEEYLPFTTDNFDANLAKIKTSGADAVLITLVGGASVGFNRAFASFGLPEKVTRLGTLIEENTLAGIGAQNAMNLYSSSGYFASIETPAAQEFAKQYGLKFGSQAPALNALAQSVYDGFLLLEAMVKKAGSMDPKKLEDAANGVRFASPRGDTTMQDRHGKKDIYLAKAESQGFKVVQVFKQVDPGKNCKA